MTSVSLLLSHTPIRVWLLLFLLLILGIKRCFNHTTVLWHVYILPTIFLVLSIRLVVHNSAFHHATAVYWLIGTLLGFPLGYYHIKRLTIRVDRRRHRIELPGDWTMLVWILAVFCLEYAIHASIAIAPQWNDNIHFLWGTSLLSGLLLGAMIGRAYGYYRHYQTSTVYLP